MRRLGMLFLALLAASLLLMTTWSSVIGQEAGFATNTPPPPPVFATNTLDPASFTDTATATATLTPTSTFTPSPSPTLTPSPTATLVGPVSYPEGYSPLTGLPYPSEEARNRRNLIIKISNYPPIVRPQSGVNAADVVYEYEVEGGVTRFAAIFRNNMPHHVGPVRSGRLVDLELIPMYEALFSYSGASEPVQDLLLGQEWSRQVISPSIGDNCAQAGFCRFPGDNLVFEHTMYADTELIWDRATARGINEGRRARGFAFSDQPDANGRLASDIFLDWYGHTDARWQYDEDSGHYVRFTDGLPHYDAADGQQLWADNVVVIEVPHEERPDLFEPESRSASQQINLWDSGRAYLFRDGQWFEGYWRRRNTDPGSALELFYANNAPMMMKPGRSWVSIVRWLGDVTVSEEQSDMQATGTALAASFTPTYTLTPGPSHTPEATLYPGTTLMPR